MTEDAAMSLQGSDVHGFKTRADLEDLVEEGKERWLDAREIYALLRNHEFFRFRTHRLKSPKSGTIVFIDRDKFKNFRNDGHNWKKDGKTVSESHEYLKVQKINRLHVYYAHGHGELNISRRCYWLIDEKRRKVDGNVLVHYLQEQKDTGIEEISGTGKNIQSHDEILHDPRTIDQDKLEQQNDSNNSTAPTRGEALVDNQSYRTLACGSLTDDEESGASHFGMEEISELLGQPSSSKSINRFTRPPFSASFTDEDLVDYQSSRASICDSCDDEEAAANHRSLEETPGPGDFQQGRFPDFLRRYCANFLSNPCEDLPFGPSKNFEVPAQITYNLNTRCSDYFLQPSDPNNSTAPTRGEALVDTQSSRTLACGSLADDEESGANHSGMEEIPGRPSSSQSINRFTRPPFSSSFTDEDFVDFPPSRASVCGSCDDVEYGDNQSGMEGIPDLSLSDFEFDPYKDLQFPAQTSCDHNTSGWDDFQHSNNSTVATRGEALVENRSNRNPVCGSGDDGVESGANHTGMGGIPGSTGFSGDLLLGSSWDFGFDPHEDFQFPAQISYDRNTGGWDDFQQPTDSKNSTVATRGEALVENQSNRIPVCGSGDDGGVSMPSNVRGQPFIANPSFPHQPDDTAQPCRNSTGKKEKSKTMVARSAYCLVCKIDCLTVSLLKKHKMGKKHKKNLQKLNQAAAPAQSGRGERRNIGDVGKAVDLPKSPKEGAEPIGDFRIKEQKVVKDGRHKSKRKAARPLEDSETGKESS